MEPNVPAVPPRLEIQIVNVVRDKITRKKMENKSIKVVRMNLNVTIIKRKMIYKEATVSNIELYVCLHLISIVFHFSFNKIITIKNYKFCLKKSSYLDIVTVDL